MERTKEPPATPSARGMPPQFLANVGQPHTGEHLSLASLHGLGLFVGMHMIPSTQVQKAMHEQHRELFLRRGAELGRLGTRVVGRDDDVAKHERLVIGHTRVVVRRSPVEIVVKAVTLEAEHVGRAIDSAIFFVQAMNFLVGRERDGDLGCGGASFLLEHVLRDTLDIDATRDVGAMLDLDFDVHLKPFLVGAHTSACIQNKRGSNDSGGFGTKD